MLSIESEIATLRAWCAAGCPADSSSLIAEGWCEAQTTGAPLLRDVDNMCPHCKRTNLFFVRAAGVRVLRPVRPAQAVLPRDPVLPACAFDSQGLYTNNRGFFLPTENPSCPPVVVALRPKTALNCDLVGLQSVQ